MSHLPICSFTHLLIYPFVCLLAACGPLTAAPTPAPPAAHEDLLRHYAPVIHQGAASDQDFLTAADFDGNRVGNDNWQHQPTGDLSAYVYGSLIETESHWFLFYALFHPRDYTPEPCAESGGCHENDMESLQVIVAKDGTPFGRPIALETLAHSHIYLYRLDRSLRGGALPVKGWAALDEGHPIVWVETYGHGIYGRRLRLGPSVVTYRPGDVAQLPAGLDEEAVSYRLLSIYETLWPYRAEMGPGRFFDKPFSYRGQVLAAAFDGDDWGQDKANTPWGYDQETGDVLSRGDWFLDPAKAFAYHAAPTGTFSTRYLYNPYLADLP
ncbi:MAG TPA: hypothetical protein ENJ31_12045 [Anaerolineae bacterium]|nr:hypothetical protein [Anaerolineae bacterium]